MTSVAAATTTTVSVVVAAATAITFVVVATYVVVAATTTMTISVFWALKGVVMSVGCVAMLPSPAVLREVALLVADGTIPNLDLKS